MKSPTLEERRKTLSEKLSQLESESADEGADSGASSIGAKASARGRLVSSLLALDASSSELLECLEAQRAEAAKNPALSKFPHVADHILRDRISKKVSNRFYNFQKAFSLPQDYLSLPDGPIPRSRESRAIRDAVFHPEKIPLEFLRDVGILFPTPGKRTSYAESVRERIRAVPDLKSLLSSSVPLPVSGYSSGRAVAIAEERFSSRGKIVAFQNFFGRESKTRGRAESSVKTYGDVFAYLRSQKYAADFLKERERALKDSAGRLAELVVSYSGSSDDARQIEGLRSELANRKTFFEQRALLDRLLNVRLKNRSQDRLRIKGAFGDMQKAFLDRMGKRVTIEGHAAATEAAIGIELSAWKALYRGLSSIPKEADVSKRGREALACVRSYELSNADFPVRPFSFVRDSLRPVPHALGTALSSGDSETVSKILRELDLLVRAQAFWLFHYGLEHDLKTDAFAFVDGNSASDVVSVLEGRIARIESMMFSGLDEAALRSPRFERYAALVSEMRTLAAKGAEAGEYSLLTDLLVSIRSTY